MGRYKRGAGLNIGEVGPEYLIRVRVEIPHIYYLTRIFEGYSHLGFAVPLAAEKGLVGIYVTPETRGEVLQILATLPWQADVC
ncbi:MAG: family peptidase [Eubacteriales bacterium]|nr:family peptidase [Eubacteriales bacterium]MDN5364018.1 family peptidase [Eubacteriales bacterium]